MIDTPYNRTAEDAYMLETFRFPQILEYSHTFHCFLFPTSVVINTVTLYTIYMRTDKSVGAVKVYILWHQICLAVNDFYIGFLMQPVGFYPHIVVISTGFMKNICSSYIGSCFLIGFLYETACVTVCTIFYRYQHVLPIGHLLKIMRKDRVHQVCGSLYILSFFLGFGSMYLLAPDTEQELEEIFLKEFPYMRPVFQVQGVYACHHTTFNNIFCLLIILYFAMCVGISTTMIYLSFKVTDSAVSEKTRRLQRSFTLKLFYQLIFPIYLLGVPGLYLAMSSIFQYHSSLSGYYNIAVFVMMSSHSIISSMTTVLIWKSYRVFLLKLIRNPIKTYKSTALQSSHREATNNRQMSVRSRNISVN